MDIHVAVLAYAAALAMLMQSQLKRVGCYTGAIDGIWGRGSRAAVAKFNAHANAALEAEPLEASIAVVTQHKARVCPVTVVRTKPKPRQLDFLRNWRLQVLILNRRWWGGGRGASRAPVFFLRECGLGPDASARQARCHDTSP